VNAISDDESGQWVMEM